jgi:hypothetical protein
VGVDVYSAGNRNSGNRFDDPDGFYGVLYASSIHVGCFVETLARFRKAPPKVIAEIQEIAHADADQTIFGTVPESWFSGRRMGRARVAKKRCADIYSSEWLSCLRREIEPELIASGVIQKGQFDLSDLMSKNRRVSQKASSYVHATGDFDGIFYQSRHGRDLDNWALFEPVRLNETSCSELHSDDAAFQKALELLDLKFDPLS